MTRRPPISTRTDTRFPDTTLFRSEQPAQAQVREHQTAGPKRLLIIEDDQYFADILEAYAKERGFETLVARHGDTGLQMAMDETPHAIILNIMLPIMDGWAVLKKLKSNPVTQDIPVHLMSANEPERSEEHTSELQSLMRNSYAVF